MMNVGRCSCAGWDGLVHAWGERDNQQKTAWMMMARALQTGQEGDDKYAGRETAEGQANDCCVKVSGVEMAWWNCSDWQGSEDCLGCTGWRD